MSNSTTSALTDEKYELEMLAVSIENMLARNFPNPTEPVQASTGENTSKERPSIFHYDGISVGGYTKSFVPEQNNEMWKYVAFMTRWHGFSIDSYLKYMKENEDVVLGYYVENIRNRLTSVGNFFWEYLMVCSCFLCFVIILLQKRADGTEILKKGYREINSQVPTLSPRIMKNQLGTKLDMLGIKNQLPLFAVEAVLTNSFLSWLLEDYREWIIMVSSCFHDIYPIPNRLKLREIRLIPPGGFKHLLHIFHWTRTPRGKFLVDPQSEYVQPADFFYIPCATALVGSATDFKKINSGGCDAVYDSKRLSGLMQVTPLHLFSYSSNLFSDLLEFEQKYIECGLSITAYIACIESLLQTKADVKLLQDNGIVQNTLKNEKVVLAVASIWREKLVRLNARIPNDLNSLSKMVIKHHERKISREYSELKSQFCPNKWVVISVAAGFVLFALTVIQTVYTALSYHNS